MDYATPQQERPPVAVTEVGTRDGFQAEERFIDTAIKAEIIDAMIAAGVRHIEATSFVSPRAVPQLADAHEVLSRLTRRKEAHIAALVPNARGAERALGAGVDEAVCFVSASETHNRANLNTSIGDALANVAEVAKIVRGKARMRGAVACAFGCPFEGEVPVEAAMRVVDGYAELGFDALTLGDTTGMATPPHCRAARRSDPQAPSRTADCPAFPQHARRRARERDGRARPRHSRVRVVDCGARRMPVRSRRDRQHLHRGSGLPARGIGIRHRDRSWRADRGGAPRRDRHRAPVAGAGHEGGAAAAQAFARRCATRRGLIRCLEQEEERHGSLHRGGARRLPLPFPLPRPLPPRTIHRSPSA